MSEKWGTYNWNRFTSIATIVASLVAAFALIFSVVQFSQSISQFEKQLTYQKKQDSIVFNLQLEQIRYERQNDSISNDNQLKQFNEVLSVHRQQANVLNSRLNEEYLINNPRLVDTIRFKTISNRKQFKISYELDLINKGMLEACNIKGSIYVIRVFEKVSSNRYIISPEEFCIQKNSFKTFGGAVYDSEVDTIKSYLNTFFIVLRITYGRRNKANLDSLVRYYEYKPRLMNDNAGITIDINPLTIEHRNDIDNYLKKVDIDYTVQSSK